MQDFKDYAGSNIIFELPEFASTFFHEQTAEL